MVRWREEERGKMGKSGEIRNGKVARRRKEEKTRK